MHKSPFLACHAAESAPETFTEGLGSGVSFRAAELHFIIDSGGQECGASADVSANKSPRAILGGSDKKPGDTEESATTSTIPIRSCSVSASSTQYTRILRAPAKSLKTTEPT